MIPQAIKEAVNGLMLCCQSLLQRILLLLTLWILAT